MVACKFTKMNGFFYHLCKSRATGDGRPYENHFVLVHNHANEIDVGTGSISLAAADKAGHVLCTDISEKMLAVARKKIRKQAIIALSKTTRDMI